VPDHATQIPSTDPAQIVEHFRGAYGTELLTAAVTEFDVFGRLDRRPLSFDELRTQIGLERRPANVLVTALRAMRLLQSRSDQKLGPTEIAREHLVRGAPFDMSDYIGLAAESPGVREMVARLRSNRPAGQDDQGAAYIFREGLESAMEQEASARHFTLALAGRAKNVAPVLAARVPLSDANVLLDVGGGTGIYAIACLQKNPLLRAIVWDRPEVLKVAAEMAVDYGVSDRLQCRAGDMFTDPVPEADVVLLSNVLHDWDEPVCQELIGRCAERLPSGGKLLIHDAFLDDDLGGPLPIALYSAALFCFCAGRAYSAAEYRVWLAEAGLTSGDVTPTLIHCGVLAGVKS